jgi:hypothetical protein
VSLNETPAPSSCRRAVVSGMKRPGSRTVAPTAETEPDHVGSVSTMTVNDARSSLVGWRSAVSLQTASGLDAAQLASTRLCVSLHPTT